MNTEFGFYEYVGKYYTDDHKFCTVRGLATGHTYIEAMENIYNAYGDELESVTIAPLEPMPIYEFGEPGILFNTIATRKEKDDD